MDFKETSIEYLTCDQHAAFYSSEAKWIRKIKQLQQSYPDQISIINESTDSILVHLPKSWLKIKPPQKRNFTEEQREALKQRMLNARKEKQNNGT